MTLPALTVTSNADTFALIGIPTDMIPPSYATLVQVFAAASALNNSAHAADASIFLNINSGTPEIVFQLGGSPTGWSASGTKYVLATFTYNIAL
jgi:hypothetical protein